MRKSYERRREGEEERRESRTMSCARVVPVVRATCNNIIIELGTDTNYYDKYSIAVVTARVYFT